MLRQDGYYKSNAKEWEDWHAGHKSTGYSYIYIKINPNNTVFIYSTTDAKFDFIDYLNKYKTVNDLTEKTTVRYLDYIIKDNMLCIDSSSLSKYAMKLDFEVITQDKLKDTEDREYNFISVKGGNLHRLLQL